MNLGGSGGGPGRVGKERVKGGNNVNTVHMHEILKIKNILRNTENQMNKFHQEIFGGNRRLPELADRKSKGQRAVRTGIRDYGIGRLSELKQREQLLKQMQKSLFPALLSGLQSFGLYVTI